MTLLAPATSAAGPKPSLPEVKRQVHALYERGELAAERYNAARIKVRNAQHDLRLVRRRMADQERTVGRMQDAVGVFAAAAYRSGGIDSRLQLVFADDPQQFVEQAASLSQLSERQAGALRQAQVARAELAQQRLTAAQQEAELERQRSAVAADKAAIEHHLAAARHLLANLEAKQRARLVAEQARARRSALAARDAAAGSNDLAGRTAGHTSRSTHRPPVSHGVPGSGRGAAAVSFAYAQLGEPYVYGAAGPSAWDCSGLTMGAWAAAGVSLPHNTRMQYAATTPVSTSALQPGDLVFFYSVSQHVGLYIGGGQVIHAPYPGQPVKIESMSTMPVVAASRP